MKQEKYGENPPDRGEQKTLVNLKDSSCSLMVGIPAKEWDDLPSTGLIGFQTSSQEVLQTQPSTDKIEEELWHKKFNDSVLRVGDTILAAASESGID